jgi:O-methyltransferase
MNDSEILARCLPYTCVGEARLAAWIADIRAALESNIQGHIIECGVLNGGCVFAASMVLADHLADHPDDSGRKVFAFDTFAGMTPPGPLDVDHAGQSAAGILASTPRGEGYWCEAAIQRFLENAAACHCPPNFQCVPGDILKTLPAAAPSAIAALRLDLDWHDTTAHALRHLASRLSPGAPIHIDDYGHWNGARQATDAWLATRPDLAIRHIDYTGIRIVNVKSGGTAPLEGARQ